MRPCRRSSRSVRAASARGSACLRASPCSWSSARSAAAACASSSATFGELGVCAVGRGGGVGLDLGAVQADQAQPHQPCGGAQLERGDQQPGQGLLVADPQAGEGHVVGRGVGAQDAEGDPFLPAAFEPPGGADPGRVRHWFNIYL